MLDQASVDRLLRGADAASVYSFDSRWHGAMRSANAAGGRPARRTRRGGTGGEPPLRTRSLSDHPAVRADPARGHRAGAADLDRGERSLPNGTVPNHVAYREAHPQRDDAGGGLSLPGRPAGPLVSGVDGPRLVGHLVGISATPSAPRCRPTIRRSPGFRDPVERVLRRGRRPHNRPAVPNSVGGRQWPAGIGEPVATLSGDRSDIYCTLAGRRRSPGGRSTGRPRCQAARPVPWSPVRPGAPSRGPI